MLTSRRFHRNTPLRVRFITEKTTVRAEPKRSGSERRPRTVCPGNTPAELCYRCKHAKVDSGNCEFAGNPDPDSDRSPFGTLKTVCSITVDVSKLDPGCPLMSVAFGSNRRCAVQLKSVKTEEERLKPGPELRRPGNIVTVKLTE